MNPAKGFTPQKAKKVRQILRTMKRHKADGVRPIAHKVGLSSEQVRQLLFQAYTAGQLQVQGQLIGPAEVTAHGNAYLAAKHLLHGQPPRFTEHQKRLMRACARAGGYAQLARRLQIEEDSVHANIHTLSAKLGYVRPPASQMPQKHSQRYFLACAGYLTGLVHSIHPHAYPHPCGLVRKQTIAVVADIANNPQVKQKTVAEQLKPQLPTHAFDYLLSSVQRATFALCQVLPVSYSDKTLPKKIGLRWSSLRNFLTDQKPADMPACIYAREVYRYAATLGLLESQQAPLLAIAQDHTEPAFARRRLSRLMQAPFVKESSLPFVLQELKQPSQPVLIAG